MDNLKIHDSLLGATLVNSSYGSKERKILAVWLSEDRVCCLTVAKDGHMCNINLPDYNWSMKVEK